ncbi:MAG: TetR/AcrR family transcriptional regulator [Deltaproteobacteria bacterium]
MPARAVQRQPRSTAGQAGRSRRPRDAGRTRSAILAAATQEFAGNGLAGARVDEIARIAGVNKALLYHYFGNKEALFGIVLEEAYANIRDAEAALELGSLSPPEAMERLVTFTWRYFVEHPDFIRLLNSENLHLARHLKRSERVRALQNPLIDRIGEILDHGAARGEFRPDVDPIQLYITIAALGYFYLSNAHTLGTAFARDLLSEKEQQARLDHIHDVVRGYLRPEPAA